jgi:hypothetical protein
MSREALEGKTQEILQIVGRRCHRTGLSCSYSSGDLSCSFTQLQIVGLYVPVNSGHTQKSCWQIVRRWRDLAAARARVLRTRSLSHTLASTRACSASFREWCLKGQQLQQALKGSEVRTKLLFSSWRTRARSYVVYIIYGRFWVGMVCVLLLQDLWWGWRPPFLLFLQLSELLCAEKKHSFKPSFGSLKHHVFYLFWHNSVSPFRLDHLSWVELTCQYIVKIDLLILAYHLSFGSTHDSSNCPLALHRRSSC